VWRGRGMVDQDCWLVVVLVGRRAVDVVVRGSHGVVDQLRGGWERLGVAPVQRGV